MELVTQAGYAASRGYTRQYINKLTKEGRLDAHGPRKLIDAAQADEVLGRGEAAAETPAAAPAPAPPAAVPARDTGSAGQSYTEARARTERIKAEQAEMELARLKGELLPRELVVEAMSDAGVRIARHLDRLVREADAIAEAAQQGGAREVRKLLREKVRDLRSDIAAGIKLPDEAGGA